MDFFWEGYWEIGMVFRSRNGDWGLCDCSMVEGVRGVGFFRVECTCKRLEGDVGYRERGGNVYLM